MEQAYRNLGLSSFIVYGVALVLLGLSVTFLFAYIMSLPGFTGLPSEAIATYSIMIVVGLLYAVLGMVVISIGPRFKRRDIKVGSIILSAILYSIILVLFAAVLFVLHVYTSNAILYLIGAALIIVAVFVYLPRSVAARIVGSIFGLAGVAILLAGMQAFPTSAEGLSPAFGMVFYASTLASVAFMIAGVSALLYSILADGGYERISFLVLGVATTIFSIAIIVDSLDSLTTISWGTLFSYSTAALSAVMILLIIALIVSTVAGFLILATSGVSFAVYGSELSYAGHPRAPAARPAPAPETVRFCKNCGASIEKGDKYCGKCGLSISTRRTGK